jgi:hypothetical protein
MKDSLVSFLNIDTKLYFTRSLFCLDRWLEHQWHEKKKFCAFNLIKYIA